jgi:hypothetical protein
MTSLAELYIPLATFSCTQASSSFVNETFISLLHLCSGSCPQHYTVDNKD